MSFKSGDRGAFIVPLNPQSNAYVKIIEQPATKAKRFRYESESKSHRGGVIPGTNSSPDNKTFPAIQILNYIGPAAVVVSCVTKDKPYRAHPHRLMGKDRKANKGIYTLEMNDGIMTAILSDLTIQYVKKNDIGKSLNERAQAKVDPFNNGFDHASDPSNIDMKAIRLCFQVFLKSSDENKYNIPLAPIVSEPIHNKDAMCDLKIVKLSKPSCSVIGGDDIILLCEKVAKDDIKIRFFEKKHDAIVWEDFGHFQQTDVHKGVAISFRTPKYKNRDIEKSVKCFIQLYKPSDDSSSDALPFEYFPLHSKRRSLIDKVKSLESNRIKNQFTKPSAISTDDDQMQQQNGTSLTRTAVESMYEQLNFGVIDIPSGSVIPAQVEHQPQFDNADCIKIKSFHDTNISSLVKNLSHQKQPPIPPNMPISDNSHQPYFNSINHVPMEPHLDANILNQQYQLNIPNTTLVDAVVNFMSNNPNHQTGQNLGQNNTNGIFLDRNIDQANQIFNGVNDDVIVESFSSMSISSGPILDSQFAVEMCSDFIKHLDNNGGETIIASNNNQLMNFFPNEEFINCGKSNTLLATENITNKCQWNYMTPCNTIV